MKNATKITPRLDLILANLAEGPTFRRNLIEQLAHSPYPVTRATLLRDLHKLILSGQITKLGTGRSTRYQLSEFNPLLIPPKPRNFSHDIHFNEQVFRELKNIFNPAERSTLNQNHRQLSISLTQLDQTIVKKELERFNIDFAWKSSAIEGNSYTLPETVTLLLNHQPGAGKTKDETQMILNHQTAFTHIWNHPPRRGGLTLSYILHLHALLTFNLGFHPGIRQSPVGISGSVYVPLPNQLAIKKTLAKTISILNNTINPVEQALIATAMISYIQPFSDGNKRTARLVGNAILLAYDHIPLSYRGVSEPEYREALVLFYEQNTILPFKKLFVEQLRLAGETYFRTA